SLYVSSTSPISQSFLNFVKNLKYDSCYPNLFAVVRIRNNPLTLFMTVLKMFSATRWKDFLPTINEGLFDTVLEEFPTTTMLIMNEKSQWYSYNHAWGSKNGPLEVLLRDENYERDASMRRELNNMPMRHDGEVVGMLVEALVFINVFSLCADLGTEKKKHKCDSYQHIHIYEKQGNKVKQDDSITTIK
ncbi:hypothetical protein KI387_007453, partial [Taxus chinensis]